MSLEPKIHKQNKLVYVDSCIKNEKNFQRIPRLYIDVYFNHNVLVL